MAERYTQTRGVFLALIWAQVATESMAGVLVRGVAGPAVQVRVFGRMSKVDVIEQVNTIWEQRHWPVTKAVHLLQRKDWRLLASAASSQPDLPLCTRQFVLPLKGPRPPAAPQLSGHLNMRKWANGGGGLIGRSSSSPGVRKDLKASWVLINANYIGAVINLGSQVLAGENYYSFPRVSASSYH